MSTLASVESLDVLMLLMCIAAGLHAQRAARLPLFVAGCFLGLLVEFMSLRFGGTHCHASGLINVSECSSLNSVMYYGPWVYNCVTAAERLTGGIQKHAFPWMCGALFFGMCGVYEMQGPTMQWWLWPRADGVVKRGGGGLWQYGELGENTADFVASPHVIEALAQRVHGFPVLAPFFHVALGWGTGVALQLIGEGARIVPMLPIVAPTLAMLWDFLGFRLVGYLFEAQWLAVAPCLMGLTMTVPLLLMLGARSGPGNSPSSASSAADAISRRHRHFLPAASQLRDLAARTGALPGRKRAPRIPQW